MSINEYFNETELAIFCRQTDFNFNDYIRCTDGTICAIDAVSGQIFIGKDLQRNKVHSLSSIQDVSADDKGLLRLIFNDLSDIHIQALTEDAEAMAARIKEHLPTTYPDEPAETDGTEAAGPGITIESDSNLTEVCSRLVNSGRESAISYLVSEAGMSVKDATGYVDKLDGPAKPSVIDNDRELQIDIQNAGPMSEHAILSTLKTLNPGDMVHVEYKPLFGNIRELDAEYVKIKVDLFNARYFALNVTADNFSALSETIIDELYDYLYLCYNSTGTYYPSDYYTEDSVRLSRVKVLRKIQNPE